MNLKTNKKMKKVERKSKTKNPPKLERNNSTFVRNQITKKKSVLKAVTIIRIPLRKIMMSTMR